MPKMVRCGVCLSELNPKLEKLPCPNCGEPLDRLLSWSSSARTAYVRTGNPWAPLD